jgi:hypothetical protein
MMVMSTDWNEAVRAYADRSTRVFTVVRSQPSWVTKLALAAALLVMVAIVLLILVPAIVVGLAFFLVGAGISRIRGLWRPNGALDGRRNVKVLVRDRE